MTRHSGRFRRTGATPWSLVHGSQSLSPLSLQPPADLVDGRWSLAVCVVCGHDETERARRHTGP